MVVLVCGLLLCLACPARAQVNESQLKSVWLEHFTRFIEWPAEEGQAYFVIKTLGTGAINDYLIDTYSNRTINGMPVKVVAVANVADVGNCHILFINESEARQIGQVLDMVQRRPILTIGDTRGFGKKGLIINFYKEGDKIRFELNISAAKDSGLEVSFRLLESARIIKNG